MFRRRTVILGFIFAVGFFSLIGRLWYLQVYTAEYYKKMGERRLHRLRPIPPSRGSILDRRGRVLAGDTASFDLWMQLASYKKIDGKRKLVSNIDVLTPKSVYEALVAAGTQREIKLNLLKKNLLEHSDFVEQLAQVLFNNNSKIGSIENSKEKVVTSIIDILSRISVKSKNGVYKSQRDIMHSFTDPHVIINDISLKSYQEIEQSQLNPYTKDKFKALDVRGGYKRVYPYGELMAHITGYTGNLINSEYQQLRGYWDDNNELVPGENIITKSGHLFFEVEPGSEEEEMIKPRIRRREGKDYYLSGGTFSNETVGRSGVEQWYNQDLRGRHVWRVEKLVKPEPDGPRLFINAGMRKDAINGKNLKLTIDVDFQQQVSDILNDELKKLSKEPAHRKVLNRLGYDEFPGVVVVMNVHNGEIYAMVSAPSYDPNKIHDPKYYKSIINDKKFPLYNRAIYGVVKGASPAGSTIKPLVGMAALEEGAITENTHFVCEGVEYIGDKEYVCLNRVHHGSLDVTDALKVSCNVFFYHAGQALGSKRLSSWLNEFGLGAVTGIDLPRERAGHLPENAFTGIRWSLGENYHLSIGQGAVDVTPVQMASAYSTIVNGGYKIVPHLKYDPSDPTLNEPKGRLKFSDKNVNIIKEGMWKVVQVGEYPRGTAFRLGMIEGFEYMGKTGSAEAGRRKKMVTHASFAAIAPYKEPEIAVVALIPYGDHGGASCARLVKRVIKAYFHLDEFQEINTNPEVNQDEEWDEYENESGSNGALG